MIDHGTVAGYSAHRRAGERGCVDCCDAIAQYVRERRAKVIRRFSVVGRPVAQGSKKHVGNGVMVETAKGHKAWRAAVTAAAVKALDGQEPFDGAVGVDLRFFFTRPKSHYRTGRFADELRPDARQYPTTPPDIDKLSRAVLDSMTDAGVFTSDARVIDLHSEKQYANEYVSAGVIVTAREIR